MQPPVSFIPLTVSPLTHVSSTTRSIQDSFFLDHSSNQSPDLPYTSWKAVTLSLSPVRGLILSHSITNSTDSFQRFHNLFLLILGASLFSR
jgi:hypothetical protein